MEQREKQILVTIISTVFIFGFYSLYVFNKYIASSPEMINDSKFWGKAFLILIPVTIVAQIFIHIVFTITNKMVTNEDMPTISDERDKLIELKAIRISHWIFTLGFLIAMGSQAIGMKSGAMFILLISSGLISSMVSEIAKIYFYRKGI
jgi:hypothetical protein